MQRREVFYSGNVQGVGFRYTARQVAGRFPVTGFVQNLPDGRVHLVVEGDPPEVTAYLSALEHEMGSYIRGKTQSTESATGEFPAFHVRH